MSAVTRMHRIARVCLALTACVMAPAIAAATPVAAAQAAAAPAETTARETLQRYATALESLDAAAVKKVQPAIAVDTLAKAFRDMKELRVVIGEVRVLSVDGGTVRVSCSVTQTLTPKAGARRTTAVTRVVRLRRDADVWVIDNFER